MRKITVEPSELESCAARMEEKNQSYVQHTQELIQAVNAMGNAWKGKDNTAFTNEITAFQATFHKLSMLCTQYTDFLRSSAKAYRQTQDELTSQANQLSHQ